MTYTAHTNEAIPVLRTVTTYPDPPWSDNYTHNLRIREFPIHPSYRKYWKDNQKVDQKEFDIFWVEHDDKYYAIPN